jgi:hypothetical protein
MSRHRFVSAVVLAGAIVGLSVGAVSAHPDNSRTLRFELKCDDGNTWAASFNGGPSAFHIADRNGDRLFVWKQIAFVTPTGETGVVGHGINGFSAAPLVTCTYEGVISGNDYTVTGFYPPAR